MSDNAYTDKKTGRRDAGSTLEVLFEISEAVTDTRSLKEFYPAIHKSLGTILNVNNFYIALYHEQTDSISFPYYVNKFNDNPEEISGVSKTASLTGRVIKERKPLIFFIKDIAIVAKILKKKHTAKVWIGAPLIIKNRVIGVISLQSYSSSKDFQTQDLNLLSTVSRHIGLAIERKESDEKLFQQRNITEKILKSSPVGICLVENRIFKWVNREMVRMFGYTSKKEFENGDVRMIYNSDSDYNTAGQIIYSQLSVKGKAGFEFILKRKDGSTFHAQFNITSTTLSHPLDSTIVTIADVSERAMAQQVKMEKERLQGVLEMAGAICHEINQPLQAILGYSSICLDSDLVTLEEIEKIKSQAKRIGKITRQLHNITEYKTKSYPGDKRIVDIWKSSCVKQG